MENLAPTMTTMNFPSLLTIKEVARILRVDETTVRRWVKQGVLEAIVLPNSVYYRIKSATIQHLLGN